MPTVKKITVKEAIRRIDQKVERVVAEHGHSVLTAIVLEQVTDLEDLPPQIAAPYVEELAEEVGVLAADEQVQS